MMHCQPLHANLLRLDTCLTRYISHVFDSCQFCGQGVAITEALQWLNGKQIEPVRISHFNPKPRQDKAPDEIANQKRAASLRYYHAHKVVSKIYLQPPY